MMAKCYYSYEYLVLLSPTRDILNGGVIANPTKFHTPNSSKERMNIANKASYTIRKDRSLGIGHESKSVFPKIQYYLRFIQDRRFKTKRDLQNVTIHPFCEHTTNKSDPVSHPIHQ